MHAWLINGIMVCGDETAIPFLTKREETRQQCSPATGLSLHNGQHCVFPPCLAPEHAFAV